MSIYNHRFQETYEKWIGQPTNFGDLKAFACSDYSHISQGKLAHRALKVICMGYLEGVRIIKSGVQMLILQNA